MGTRKGEDRATIVVSPRERLETLAWSLESLFATIGPGVPVIVVEAGLPPRLRRRLDALARARPFRRLALAHYATPNRARNLGAAAAATEFVVFADNDLVYEPGWLEALVANAERTGAAAVAPLICIGPPAAATIHHAGGLLHATGDRERPVLVERHRLMDRPMGAFNPLTAPERNEVAEFHCALVRRAVLERLGPLDERLITREQMDFALRLKIADETVTFARDAVVTYMRGGPVGAADLGYFLYRWSHALAAASLDAFEATWGVTLERARILGDWIGAHRARAIAACHPLAALVLGRERFRRRFVPWREARAARDPLARGAPPPRVPAPPSRAERDRVVAALLARDGTLEAALPAPFAKPIGTNGPAADGSAPVVAGMATMPGRRDTAAAAIASLLPQVDRLYLFLDGGTTPPVADAKITVLTRERAGDLKANGKFLGLAFFDADCLYFTADDDIAYPADYVAAMRAALARHGFAAAVGVHASVMNRAIRSYRADRVVAHRSAAMAHDFPADVLGTCSLAFASARLRFDVRAWPAVNMVDLSFAALARARGVPLVGVARPRGWLACLAEDQPDSIFRALQADDSRQTQFARQLFGPG